MSAALKRIFYGATSLEQAKQFVSLFKKEFAKKYPTAWGRLTTDLDQCLSLIYAVSQKYASQQNIFTVTDIERAILQRLRERKIEMITQLELDVWAA